MSVTETKGCEQTHQVYIRKPQRKYHYKKGGAISSKYICKCQKYAGDGMKG